MHLDVLDLRNFYYRTQLGRVAQRAVRDRLTGLWPVAALQGQTVVGFGFAVPLLRPYLTSARRVIGLMPGPQGVMPWPAGEPNVSVLCDECKWPISTGLVDRLVVMHGLETSDTPSEILEECARVLGPGGRVIFIVPNRSGIWSRGDGTPFGFGRPYSASQIDSLLRDHGFTPERHASALFSPPSEKRFWLGLSGALELTARRFAPWFAGGVLMIEASKQVHAPKNGGLGERIRRPLRILEGVGAKSPVPALKSRD